MSQHESELGAIRRDRDRITGNLDRVLGKVEDRSSRIQQETWRDAATNRLGLGMWSGKVLACRFAVFCVLLCSVLTFVSVYYRTHRTDLARDGVRPGIAPVESPLSRIAP